MNQSTINKRKEYLKRSAEKGWEFRNRVLRSDLPFLFNKERKPLALGFFKQLRAQYPTIPYNVLKMFLNEWTKTTTYILSLTKHKYRFNLDGTVSSSVSEEHISLAKRHLAKNKRKAKQERKKRNLRKKIKYKCIDQIF